MLRGYFGNKLKLRDKIETTLKVEVLLVKITPYIAQIIALF